MMKLLRNTQTKIAKDKNGENIPQLGITEIILVHYNLVNSTYQYKIEEFYVHLNQINYLEIYLKFHHQSLFYKHVQLRVFIDSQNTPNRFDF